MPGLHAKLSASGSHRWINCPGSVKAEEGIKDKTSPFAQWGTACHELSELCLLSGEHAEAHLNKEVAGVTVDDEMINTAQSYIDYVNSYRNTHSLCIESRVDFSEWVPGGFGTCDCIGVSLTGDDLVIIDLKGGKGVRVDAENNTQLMLYALGALAEYDYLIEPEKVKMVIVQPRLDHVSEWEIPTSELLAHGNSMAKAATTALSDNAQRNPGEKQCQFCKAKATCPALKTHTEQTLLADFDNLNELKAPDKLSNDDLKNVLDNAKLISTWIESVQKYAHEQISSGQEFPGYKLVAGRSLRKWSDESDVAKLLLNHLDEGDVYTKKLIGVPAAEKLLKKDKTELTPFIVKPEGKPTLAPESDKRPAINITLSDFD